MAQSDFGNLESPLSGSAFVNTYLEPWRTAVHTSHSGITRPSYAAQAMVWMDTTTNPWVWKCFDGTDDIVIGTFDITANLFTAAGAVEASDVPFDGTASGLSAVNVQDAIDELMAELPVSIRLIPQNSKSTNYTLTLADAGGHILHPSSDVTPRAFTIPANSAVPFPRDTAITFVNQNGAGVLTIGINTDTLRLAGSGATGNRTLAANGVATALKISATEWIISGTGLS